MPTSKGDQFLANVMRGQKLIWRPYCRAALVGMILFMGEVHAAPVSAATIAPPMLDITRRCDVDSRHNAAAMSECVVAESEARAEMLQKWDRFSDADALKCIKIGRKSKRLPYSAMAKCLAVQQVDVRPVGPAPATGTGATK
jgi:predicted phage-related endonuclease